MAAREHSRSGRVHPDATVMTSRRALLGAVLAAPALTAANAFARHPGLDPGPSFFSPPPQGRWIPDQVRNDESGAANSFTVTKCDRAPSLPDHPEPGRRVRNGGSGEAQSLAVTKYDRALARFRRAERIVKAAEGEPDQDRAVYPERPRRGLSKGHPARPLPRHAPLPPPHSRPSSPRPRRQARRREPPCRLGAHRRRNLRGRARAGCPSPRSRACDVMTR